MTPSLFFLNKGTLKATGRICSSLLREMTKWFGNMYPLMVVSSIGGVWFQLWNSGEYTFSLLSYPLLDCIVICFQYTYWIGNGNYRVVFIYFSMMSVAILNHTICIFVPLWISVSLPLYFSVQYSWSC